MFKCKICNYNCHYNYSGTHLKKKHNITGKVYYDNFLKKEQEGFCKVCNSKTSFFTIKRGYKECCSLECANKYKNISLKENFGVDNYFQIDKINQKAKQTLREKYGVENISQLESVKEKKKKTLLKNYGVEFGLQHPEIKKRQERTMLKRYGKKQAMHVPELKRKAVLNGGGRCSARFYTTKFGDKITIQGSYEEKFVKLCEDNNIRIVNGPCIDYLINGEQHKYFVDFIIYQNDKPRLVEIKSSYYFEEYKEQCLAKAEAAIKWSQKYQYLDYALLIDEIEIPLDQEE